MITVIVSRHRIGTGTYHLEGDCAHQPKPSNREHLSVEVGPANKQVFFDGRAHYPCRNCFGDNFARPVRAKASIQWPPS